MWGYREKHLSRLVCFLFRHLFGDTRSQLFAITGCYARGLFGPLSGDVQPPAELAFKGVRIGQSGVVSFSVKLGTNTVKRGYRILYSVDFGGIPFHVLVKRGNQVAPPFAAAPFCPNTVPEKNKWCACSAWAAGVMSARHNRILRRLGQARARSAPVFSLYRQMTKNRGYTPH